MTEPSAIAFVQAQIITAEALDDVAVLQRFLDALEASPLTPTHWGASRGIRDPYDRHELDAHVRRTAREDLVPELRRTSSARYSAHWLTGEHGLSSFELVSVGPTSDEAAIVFDTVESISDALPVEIASIDIRFADQDPATLMRAGANVHHLSSFISDGPDIVFPRTIFGPRVASLMGGRGGLDQSAAVVRTLPQTGGLAFDLADKPWTASATALKRGQVDVERHLRLAGMLARAAGSLNMLPGPRWKRPVP